MNLNLNSLLKNIKLHESVISMVLGVAIVFLGGWIIYKSIQSVNVTTETPSVPMGQVTQKAAKTENTNFVNVEELEFGEKTKPVEGGGYIVQSGDTLWGIAERELGSGFRWKEIAAANGISNPQALEIGQKLALGEVVDEGGQVMQSDAREPIRGATYTVEGGDCLWNIAVRAYGDGYRWVDIAAENNLLNPDLIHKGNGLRIPRT